MKKILLTLVFLGLIFWPGSFMLYARDISNSSKEQYGWVNIGFGVNPFEQYAAVMSISYQRGIGLFSIRGIYIEEGFDLFGPTPVESVWDLGVLLGISLKSKYFMASLSGGIGAVGGILRGEFIGRSGFLFQHDKYEEIHFTTVGVPIEAQLFFTPLFFLGFGIYGAVNINPEKIFAEWLLCLQSGKLMACF